MTGRRWLLLLVAGFAALLVLGRVLAGVYSDWRWYESMGALPLYQSALAHGAALRLGALAIGFVLAFLNLYAVRSSIVSLVLPRRLGNIEIGEAVSPRSLMLVVMGASLVLALALAIPQDDWTVLALARIGLRFGEYDPYTERDFGSYLYELPFERSVYEWALLSTVAVTALVVMLYAITPSLRIRQGKVYISTWVRRHLSVLAALLLMLVSWSYRIELLSLLADGSASGGAFGKYDHRLLSPLLATMSVATGGSALLLLWAGWKGHRRVSLFIVSALILCGPVARALLPLAWRWLYTEAQRTAKDRPYQATRTLFTRRAFALDDIVRADSAHVPLPTPAQLAIGVSAWDPLVLEQAAGFDRRTGTAAAVVWRPQAGGLVADVVQRPVGGKGDWALLPTEATLTDERGRAVAAVSIAERSRELLPVLVSDSARGTLVIPDTMGLVASPRFHTWLERLGHAWRLQNPGLLFLDASDPRTRVVFRRDLRERIHAIVPFFTIGPTIQAVTSGDSLYWMAELFVTSNEYPLADTIRFAKELPRYVRHAATALVQAHSGRVTIVADPQPDPVTRSWMHRFPWLFVSRESLPGGLGNAWPPNVDWAAVQAAAILRAGFAGDTLFPARIATGSNARIDLGNSPPVLFAQNGERGPLAQSTAMVNADGRVVGVLVARGGDLPRTEWYVAPATPWYGAPPKPAKWSDVLDRMLEVAKGAGYERGRATDKRGRVQVIPAADGLAYVQTFYDGTADGPPAVQGVVAMVGVQPFSGRTLQHALGTPRGRSDAGTAALRQRATVLYDAMAEAMRRGDWPAFGRAYDELGKLLGRTPR